MKKIGMDTILFFLLIFSFGITAYSFLTVNGDDVKIDSEHIESFNKGWIYVPLYGESITLPKKIASDTTEPSIIKNRLQDQWKGLTLSFRTSDQLLKVFIDGEQVYSFGYDNERAFGKTPGSAWHFIPIPTEFSKGEVRIELSAAYEKFRGKLPSIYVGTKSAIVLNLIRNNLWKLLSSIFMLLFGIFLIIIYFIMKKVVQERKSFIYLGVFSILMSFSCLIESRLLQIFVGDQTIFSNGIFIVHMLAPIAMTLYVGETYFFEWRRKYQLIAKVFVINYIMAVALQLTNQVDFMETKVVTHALVLLSCLYMFITMIQLIRKQKKYGDLLYFAIGLLVLMTSILMDLVRYYQFRVDDASQSYRMGLLAFIIILSYLDLKRTVSLIRRGIRSKSLMKIAYEDGLTRCKNRIYFEEKFLEAGKTISNNAQLGIAIFDVNDLKKINDSKGHSEGDSMLIHVAKLIKEYFSQYAHVSRIGGDEFALIISGVEEAEVEVTFKKFHTAMKESTINTNDAYDIAYGYAQFKPEIDKDLHETFNRADSIMYSRKKRMKKRAFD